MCHPKPIFKGLINPLGLFRAWKDINTQEGGGECSDLFIFLLPLIGLACKLNLIFLKRMLSPESHTEIFAFSD